MQTDSRRWHQALWFYGLLCLLVFLFGGLFRPGDWYEALNKAPWTPPNIAFPIAWASLYVMIAVAGYWASISHDRGLIRLWYAQLGVNAAWSWVFFGQHWAWAALINLLLLLLLVIWFVFRGAKSSRRASVFMLPYLAWLCLATSLNAYIVVNN